VNAQTIKHQHFFDELHKINVLSKRGMDVIELDITEILKAGGGPHCMTFPLERI
jgi:N-dimethylarginine dimethylaminohydrolase